MAASASPPSCCADLSMVAVPCRFCPRQSSGAVGTPAGGFWSEGKPCMRFLFAHVTTALGLGRMGPPRPSAKLGLLIDGAAVQDVAGKEVVVGGVAHAGLAAHGGGVTTRGRRLAASGIQ